ncbi:MAG: hypothetical protein DKM50_10995 [Candidatus Margulisiibacteriota bacterium]|nr:MAG: hypothetical protein A2X43_07805 [Candidatus Margulisbacteria bacterium GWD2_39_127]OGI03873.1 MAG: hypothetical protein A2X42_09930 [Candidatus Margulisbacteria bacterium GWF2_38_17]OGI08822.1 MAG: hypothetical protein A2X41_05185 [Candidatus Margulisbacteria bacterium GWE2_39_32]PZM78653.1 MAG: hypothetical protein DKM50_10995 [Candidatus Margulisiibacteriota bacterium]HAR61995.1 hypothetical protein [Candidatus Margulisiibacteriota bacterium]
MGNAVDNEYKTKILELTDNLTVFLTENNIDSIKNTTTVIASYKQSIDFLKKIDNNSIIEEDLKNILVVLGKLDTFIPDFKDKRISPLVRSVALQTFRNSYGELLSFMQESNIDAVVSELFVFLDKELSVLGSTRKELEDKASKCYHYLTTQNQKVFIVFIKKLAGNISHFLKEIKNTDDVSRTIVIALLMDKLSLSDTWGIASDVEAVNKFIARGILGLFKQMSKEMPLAGMLKNVKIINSQLPSEILKYVEGALPDKIKRALKFEELLVFVPAMEEQIASLSMNGIIIRRVAVGDRPQDEVRRLLLQIKQERLSKSEVISILRSKTKEVVLLFLGFLDNRDRELIASVLFENRSNAQIITRK